MFYESKLWVAKSGEEKVGILPKMANRHGLIAGATGTGKTITLKVLAESFSEAGVPVFLADAKGDLAGMCQPGVDSADMQGRIAKFGLAEAGFQYQAYPTCFWDILEEKGLPLRTTISEMGATLLSRLMDLTQTQTDVLTIIFRIADDEGLLLIDTKDLRAMLSYVSEHNKDYTSEYGNIAKQSVGAIMRAVVALEEQGGDKFFGEPALDIRDWFRTDFSGKGMINILHCASLINNPKIYSTFMLWMMSELFEIMPEAGDCDKPKMVFFFDEAHLLFHDAPKALLQKIEQVVKLIRSKGIGIYFITQSPSDIPDEVLSQLGNKVQHALRAYTPADQKAIKAAAQSFRVNPELDTETVLTELGTGEALVSFLQEDGSPSIVKRCKILPPQSQMGVVTDGQRTAVIGDGVLYSKYGTAVDRDSAYEFLQRKGKQEAEDGVLEEQEKLKEKESLRSKKRVASSVGKVAHSAAGTIGRELGNELGRKMGGTFGRRLGGNIGASLGRGILDTFFGR